MDEVFISQLAKELDIAEIRIWQLVRNRKIKAHIKYGESCIYRSDFFKWAQCNSTLLQKWKDDYRKAKQNKHLLM